MILQNIAEHRKIKQLIKDMLIIKVIRVIFIFKQKVINFSLPEGTSLLSK